MTSRSPQQTVATTEVGPLMREIRLRARAQNRERDASLRAARKAIPTALTGAAGRLKDHVRDAKALSARIGKLPPAPPTLRAKFGGILVRLAQRSLFWLLPPVKGANEALVAALEQQSRANDELLQLLQRMNMEIASLKRANRTDPAELD